jgi:hypothetical protein
MPYAYPVYCHYILTLHFFKKNKSESIFCSLKGWLHLNDKSQISFVFPSETFSFVDGIFFI